MSDLDEPTLELLLREHLSAELDGQLGRSATAFLRHVGGARESGAASAEPVEDRPPLRLADSAPAPPEAASSRFGPQGGRSSRWLNGWLIGLAGAALAASVAALWTAPVAFRGGVPAVPVRSAPPADPGRPDNLMVQANPQTPAVPAPTVAADAAADPWNPDHLPPPSPQQPTIRWVQNQAWDEGPVVLDDDDQAAGQPGHVVPARKIREQQWEHTQWYDPARRARVEMTLPKQNVKFVEMDTY